VGAPPALHDGLHLPRAPRRGDLPVQEPALAKAGDGTLPSDFFRRNVVLSFQEDAIGIRLRDAIGVDNIIWGSDYPHSESTFPQSLKILAELLAGVPDDEQAKIAGGNTARVYNFDVARLTVPA
jgi:predicted TIM-barrel fold metal-dependent hydrolase